NPDHALRIAMTAQVTIVINAARDVLTLPASALGSADRRGVYHVGVYDEASGAVRPAEVKVGLNDNITAEITEGLAEGDKVVTGATRTTGGAGAQGAGARGGGNVLGGGGPMMVRRGG